MPPLKPEVCVVGDRLAVFVGADYKLLDLETAERFCRLVQSEAARLRRQHKRAQRALRKAGQA